jgi:hypothetical protein
MKKLFTLILIFVAIVTTVEAQNLNQAEWFYSKKHELLREYNNSLAQQRAKHLIMQATISQNSKATYQRLDSFYYKTSTGIVLQRQVFTYNNSGKAIESMESTIDPISGQFVDNYKTVMAYNASGQLISETGYEWDDITSQWVYTYKNEYSYTAGNRSELIYSYWDDVNSVWEVSGKNTFLYNANNQMISSISYYWDSSTSTWIDSWKEVNTYTGNNLTLTESFNWNSGSSTWEISYKTENTYNSSNKMTESIDYSWDAGTSVWEESSKTGNTYDTNGDLISEISYSWDGTAWEQDSKSESTFNTNYAFADLLLPSMFESNFYLFNHMLTEFKFYFWDVNTWLMEDIISLYYSPMIIIAIEESEKSNISIYPNPASETIQIGGINDLLLFELYDMSGKKLISEEVVGSEKVSLQNVEPGIYFYSILINGKTSKGKIVKR